MAPHFEPVSSVDSAWLSMEHPTNLMMMSGIITFNHRVDMDHLRAVLEHRWLAYHRFRQRVSRPAIPFAPEGWTPAFWENDSNFDLANHLTEFTLPDPGDYPCLQEHISDIMSTPLDMAHPLWHMELIHTPNDVDVLAIRVHHVIADGISMVQVLLSLTDDEPNAPPPGPPEGASESEEEKGGASLIEEAFTAVLQHASTAASTVIRMSEKVLIEILESLSDPEKALNIARQGTEGAQTVQRVLLRANDPETIFKGELGRHKAVAWSQPIPLPKVKAIKNQLGGTVNDVLGAAIAGGLRRFLIRQGQPVDELNIRAAIPVNLRKPDEPNRLGNKFGLVFLSLPIGIEDPVERLLEVRRRMDQLKHSQEAPLFFGLLKSLGYTPGDLQSSVVAALAHKITAVMSNVPGPREPLYFAGQQIESMMFWVPQSGRVALGVSFMSYNDQVYVGVNTDAGLVPYPDGIIDGFYEEFLALLKVADATPEPVPTTGPEKRRGPSKSKARPRPPAAKRAPAPDRCRATTKAGKPCRNKALAGGSYCRVHAESPAPPAADAADPAT